MDCLRGLPNIRTPPLIPNFQNQFFTFFHGFLRSFDKIYSGKVKTIQKTIFYVETNQKIVIFRKIGKKNLDVSEPEASEGGLTPP